MNPLEILQTLTPQELAVGSGVTFPIEITNKTRRVWDESTRTYKDKQVSGWYPKLGDLDLIINNLQSVMLYPLGFRLRQEDYGNNLEACIEEPNTQALNFFIKDEIRSLLVRYEGRISYKSCKIKNLPNGIAVRIHYTINTDVPLDDYLDMFIPSNS